MNERKPISIGFHPTGLLFIPLFAAALAALDITYWSPSWQVYLWVALWVVPWHLFQLGLDYRHTECWYRLLTSPPFRLTLRRLLSLRWPALVALLPVLIIGVIPVSSIWIACVVLYYPWQRSLYNRSHLEFGPKANRANA